MYTWLHIDTDRSYAHEHISITPKIVMYNGAQGSVSSEATLTQTFLSIYSSLSAQYQIFLLPGFLSGSYITLVTKAIVH